MSTISLYRRAMKLYNCGIDHIDRHNRRQWVIAVKRLGVNWLLAAPRSRLS